MYSGNYSDDKEHGHGTYEYFNGDKFVGNFYRGKREGKGIYTVSSGKIIEGIWRNDTIQHGTITLNNLNTYGKFKYVGISLIMGIQKRFKQPLFRSAC